MKTAVIYARFSCSKQREASIEDQLRVCTDWCDANGYEVVNTYSDSAISGRTDERPAFQAMISNAGESDIVLVYMMDRFSRDPYDAPIYKKKLADKGVKVVSATESIPDTVEAVLLEKIYEGLAAVESAHISERTKRGMTGNALKAMHNGVRVFGYAFGEDGRYVIDEDEAEIVREVFSRRIRGEAPTSIAKSLAVRGVKTSMGKPASDTMVRNMLKNRKYIGEYRFGEVTVPDGMPAIVKMETFLLAQKAPAHKSRASENWTDFLLTGRLICLNCGHGMSGMSGRNHAGEKYTYYRCKHCNAPSIRADVLESAIATQIRSMLGDRAYALSIAQRVADYVANSDRGKRIEQAKKRKHDAQKALDNFYAAISQGMDYNDIKDRIALLKAQIAAADAEVYTYQDESIDVEDFADFLQFGATLDDRNLINAMVYQVWLDGDNITVTLNYNIKEGEPERIQVRPDDGWLPNGDDRRTVAIVRGRVLICFPRTGNVS